MAKTGNNEPIITHYAFSVFPLLHHYYSLLLIITCYYMLGTPELADENVTSLAAAAARAAACSNQAQAYDPLTVTVATPDLLPYAPAGPGQAWPTSPNSHWPGRGTALLARCSHRQRAVFTSPAGYGGAGAD